MAQLPEWASAGDVTHLEKAGHITSKVREYHDTMHLGDRGTGSGTFLFQRKEKTLHPVEGEPTSRNNHFGTGSNEGR